MGMDDLLVLQQGTERRGLPMAQAGAAGGALPPSPEFLHSRLDQIDQRLRQLEEQQRPPRSYWSGDLQWMAARPPDSRHHHHLHQHHQHSRSLSSALHEVHLKGTLMDRLHLLESRIQQLSSELDKGSTTAAAGTSTTTTTTTRPIHNENALSQQSLVCADLQKQQGTANCSSNTVGGPWTSGEIFQIGARDIPSHQKPKSKAKDPKELAVASAEKRGSGKCRNEKRPMERTRLYRRWFPVGC